MSSFGCVHYCSCQHVLFLLSPKGKDLFQLLFFHQSHLLSEDDWLITSFRFKVASCSFAYLTRSVLVHCSLSSLSPHHILPSLPYCDVLQEFHPSLPG